MVATPLSLNATFAALADPTRRAILTRLAIGESTVTELSEPFDVSLPAISKHVRVLEEAGLLVREREGRVHRCRLGTAPLRSAADWIARYERFWETQFDALDRYLSAPKEEKPWRKQSKPSRTTRSTTRRAKG